MVDRIRWDTVSYLPFYYVFFQFLLLTIFNLQANILTTKDILSNLAWDKVRGFLHLNPAIDCFQHEECPRRLVACQFCQLEVHASELPKHTEYCGSRTERCKGCNKSVQVRHLQFHYNSDHKYLAPEEKGEHSRVWEGKGMLE